VFVTDPGEEMSPTIVKWVEAFVPAQIGEGKYLPHLTVGVAKFDDLKVIEAEPVRPVHGASRRRRRLPPRQQWDRPRRAEILAALERTGPISTLGPSRGCP
jgi:hypothetical protein